MRRTRPIIGILINSIDGLFQGPIIEGLREEATRQDVSLVFFPGQYLAPEYLFNKQFNVMYALAHTPQVSAYLSLTTTFNARKNDDETLQFLRQYTKPLMSFGFTSPGYLSVMLDNTVGLNQLFEHLIHTHGYRRIAFMRGPDNNIDADERYFTYLNALSAAGLPFDPDLVVQGNFHQYDGRKAMETLLARGVVFDVLAAANDEMAHAAMAVALEHGFRVPEDFAITGFDDILSIYKEGPPLSTVHLPMGALAANGLKVLLAHLKGEAVAEVTYIPTHPVLRQTCGCVSSRVAKKQNPLQTSEDKIINALNLHPAQEPVFKAYLARLQTELFNDNPVLFETELNAIIKENLAVNGDISTLQTLLINIQRYLISEAQHSKMAILRYTEQLQLGQISIANTLIGQRLQDSFKLEYNRQTNLNFLRMGATSFNQAEMLTMLTHTLDKLDITTCYLALYPQAITYDSLDTFKPPAISELIYARHESTRHPELEGKKFATLDLIPGGLPAHFPLIGIQPIFQHDQHFGYVMFDIKSAPILSNEQIREEISSTLSGALMVAELAHARDLLREDLDVAAETNQHLASLAEHDELTGLFNRRGFYMRAEASLKNAASYPILLIFADLDGLKQINDEHGHADGDFAIKTASQLLISTFRTSDVVCRLGGDEFVILSLKCPQEEMDTIKERIYADFERFNLTTDKPYAVRCSVGYCVVDPNGTESLHTLISQADKYLYEEKRRRKALRLAASH